MRQSRSEQPLARESTGIVRRQGLDEVEGGEGHILDVPNRVGQNQTPDQIFQLACVRVLNRVVSDYKRKGGTDVDIDKRESTGVSTRVYDAS